VDEAVFDEVGVGGGGPGELHGGEELGLGRGRQAIAVLGQQVAHHLLPLGQRQLLGH
jgi:hypothetical protein